MAAPATVANASNIACILDPPGLDPTVNAVDLVSTITENVFDTLYAFDAKRQPAPLLGAGPAEVTDDGKTVGIPLRSGVVFHGGTPLTSADVAASLRRWMKLSSRGQLVAPVVTAIDESAPNRVVLRLSEPYPALLPLLAFNSGTAIILPKAKAEAAMGGPITRIEDLVGTGPFRVAERRPDQYTLLDRAERYTASPMPASAYAGARTPASARLSFLPVPNVSTRLQGLLSGEYDGADGLSTDSFAQIQHAPGIVPVITKPGGWLFLVMNSQRGLTINPLIRQAAQAALDNEAIMMAAMEQVISEAFAIDRIGAAKEWPDQVAALLAQVSMPPDATRRYPHEFSGGQRQRIGIARALAVAPACIIADEPVSALDVSVQAQVVNLLQELQTRLQLGVLFIAHDLAVVQHVSDRVVVLYMGRVMEFAPSHQLYAAPRHPYTAALMDAAPVPDPRRRITRQPLRGEMPRPEAPPSGCVFRTRCPHVIADCARIVPTLTEVAPGHWKACIRDDVP
jgi:oligopeptide/dipeptide ABC transporter ATP-binding protein